MKRECMIALSCLLFVSIACAKNCTEQELSGGERIIQYTVTLYREEECNTDRWEEMTKGAYRAIARGRQEMRPDMVQLIVQAIQNISFEDNGIHGELSVSVSDGSCSPDRCGEGCACAKRFGGLCPCVKNDSEGTKSCCKKETAASSCNQTACDDGGSCKKSGEK